MTQTFIPAKMPLWKIPSLAFSKNYRIWALILKKRPLNPVPNVWSVHIRDRDCPLCFTNGKGASKKAALASALGEYFERLSTNYFCGLLVGRVDCQRRFCPLSQ